MCKRKFCRAVLTSIISLEWIDCVQPSEKNSALYYNPAAFIFQCSEPYISPADFAKESSARNASTLSRGRLKISMLSPVSLHKPKHCDKPHRGPGSSLIISCSAGTPQQHEPCHLALRHMRGRPARQHRK